MAAIKLTFEDAAPPFEVERFTVQECLSTPFEVTLWVSSKDSSVDIASLVGRPAALAVATGYKAARDQGRRAWSGICVAASQTHARREATAADRELSRYELRILPHLWRLSLRRNCRIFQHQTLPQMIDAVLDDWQLPRQWAIDKARYPQLETRVQYGERDLAFVQRLLEEAGISYAFRHDPQRGSVVTFRDAVETAAPRPGPPLRRVDNPNQAAEQEYVSQVVVQRRVRPGAVVLADDDFRNPALRPQGARKADRHARLEQFRYRHGSLRTEGLAARGTPVADKRGVAGTNLEHAEQLAHDRLLAWRRDHTTVAYTTNVVDLWPGTVFTMDPGHPSLPSDDKLVVLTFETEGNKDGEWSFSGTALRACVPLRPPEVAPRPLVRGPQSATVVGPPGEEIHCDEHGRVRVLFPWYRRAEGDRQGQADDRASCWLRVNQGWAGTGYGVMALPRVGQEVLVGFVQGNPDEPVVLGRVFNAVNTVPYRLPKQRLRSGFKSHTSPGSGGFNEWRFDDTRGEEELFIQAQKNLRKLVKHDQVGTVGHDRRVRVEGNTLQTVQHNRHEHVAGDRVTLSAKRHRELVQGQRVKQVVAGELQRSEGAQRQWVQGGRHVVVGRRRRRLLRGDADGLVAGSQAGRIGGDDALSVGSAQHVRVVASHALRAAGEVHLKSGNALVGEAPDITFKVGGSFVRIDAGGVTVRGPMVLINSGGTPGSGSGANPQPPEEAETAELARPSAALDAIRAEALDQDIALPQVRSWPAPPKIDKVVAQVDGDRPAKRDDKVLTWIAIELRDDEGNPVAGERYEITLPDGRKRSGVTDKDGKAHVEGIDPGTCQVTFPRLDKDVWKRG